MGIVTKILSWFRPASDPESEAEAQRMRVERETIRTSQLGGSANIPPTRDVTDPRR